MKYLDDFSAFFINLEERRTSVDSMKACKCGDFALRNRQSTTAYDI